MTNLKIDLGLHRHLWDRIERPRGWCAPATFERGGTVPPPDCWRLMRTFEIVAEKGHRRKQQGAVYFGTNQDLKRLLSAKLVRITEASGLCIIFKLTWRGRLLWRLWRRVK